MRMVCQTDYQMREDAHPIKLNVDINLLIEKKYTLHLHCNIWILINISIAIYIYKYVCIHCFMMKLNQGKITFSHHYLDIHAGTNYMLV